MKAKNATFAQLGEIFNDATTREIGGIDANNQAGILRDLSQVQTGLQNLLQTHPEQFQGVSAIHAQNVVDQLNLEMNAIKTVGTDPFAAKYINDVQRDLIDIVQGDDALVALATKGNHNGFAAVPDLLVPPAQFQGDQMQTDFMKNFAATSQSLADKAVALADNHGSAQDVQQLVSDIQTFEKGASEFSLKQGGLYSARFDNEFAENGVNGTTSRALIDGLQTGNVDKVHAAAEVLAANAADVAGNMLGIGQAPPAAMGKGIPAHFDTLAQVGTVFNDATAKLVGGVYSGNQQSIHNDLTATQQGLQQLLTDHPDQFQGKSADQVNKIVGLLGQELKLVDNPTPGATDPTQINALHSQIINTVQHNATLSAAAAQGVEAPGFMALPGTLKGHGLVAGNGNGAGNGAGQGAGDGGPAQGHGGAGGHHAIANADMGAAHDHLSDIFGQFADHHHHG